jgi:dipeptidase D
MGCLGFFKAVSAVPRESGNEKGIAAFLVSFAGARGLTAHQDEWYNVVIVKPASPGREGESPVFLQAHTDMVCVKTPESSHDFTRDPIEIVEDGDFIHAVGTSLGADNGIGVAMILDVLDSEFSHPPLTCLFTVDEERGLAGVKNLDLAPYPGNRLINLDAEEEGVFLASCAGGVRCALALPLEWEDLGAATDARELHIAVTGLKGGHSGLEIDKEHANAILVLGRLLRHLGEQHHYVLLDMKGGGKENSIPAQAEAAILCTAADAAKIRAAIDALGRAVQAEYAASDAGLHIAVTESAPVHPKVVSAASAKKLLDLALLLPNGQIHRDLVNDSPLTSSNVGVLKIEDGKGVISSMVRSNVDSSKHAVCEVFDAAARLAGAKLELQNDYPAWEYSPRSALRDHCVRVYEEQFGAAPQVQSIHGGLECAYLAQKRPSLDLISFGCNLCDVHSVNERMSLSSAVRTCQFLKAVLTGMR